MNINQRNSVQHSNSYSHFEFYWAPHPSLPAIFCHRFTKKQIESHELRVRRDQLELQTSLISGRINNKHPFICSLYFFHCGGCQQQQNQAQSLPIQQLWIYTDRMIALEERDWSRMNVIHALIGFKRLVMTYGPIRITQNMLKKNENGEMKVWISQKQYKNKPDYPLFNEDQTAESFLLLLLKKKASLYQVVKDCKTLREMIDKLERLGSSKSKHKHSPSISYQPTNLHVMSGDNFYSGQHDIIKLQNQSVSPRNKSNSEHKLFNSLWNSKKNFNLNKIDSKLIKSKEFSKKSASFFVQNSGPKMFGGAPSNQYKNMSRLSGNYEHFRPEEPNFKFFPSTPPPRFATGQFSSFPRSHGFSHRGEPTYRFPGPDYHFPKNSYDITIINNNVSNYISNFAKNHFPGPETTERTHFHAKNVNQSNWKQESLHFHPKGQAPLQANDKKRVPSFIANKGKGFNSQAQSYQGSNQVTRLLINSSKNDDYTIREERDTASFQRKDVKMFTFCSNQKELLTEVPPIASVTQSRQIVLRKDQKKKTFETIQKGIRPQSSMLEVMKKKERKLSHQDLERLDIKKCSNRSSADDKEYARARITEPSLTEERKGRPEGEKKKSIEGSIELKRQLKKEYGHLLGFDVSDPIEQEKLVCGQGDGGGDSEGKKSSRNQSLLKVKIEQKKQAFAELKKEALKVLTDL